MKSREFAAVIASIARLLRTANPGLTADRLEELASVFDAAPNQTVAQLVKRLGEAHLPQQPGNTKLEDLAPVLAPLDALFAVTAKAAFMTDFTLLRELARSRPQADLASMRAVISMPTEAGRVRRARAPAPSALQEDVVRTYQQRLEAHLGDREQFAGAYAALCKDKSVKLAEAKTLAKAMTGLTAKSKAEAFRTIWDRHQALMAVRAKNAATGGRSAA